MFLHKLPFLEILGNKYDSTATLAKKGIWNIATIESHILEWIDAIILSSIAI